MDYWKSFGVKELPISELVLYGAATFDLKTIDSVFKKTNGMFFSACYRPVDACKQSSVRKEVFTQLQVIINSFDCAMSDNGLHIAQVAYDSISGLIGHHAFEMKEDNWNAPTMKSYGIGWEYRVFGLEVLQITKFTKFLNIDVSNQFIYEFAYGIDRIMYLAGKKHDVDYDLSLVNKYKTLETNQLFEILNLIIMSNSQVSYENFLLANLVFNLLDARHCFSIFDKNLYMKSICNLVEKIQINC